MMQVQSSENLEAARLAFEAAVTSYDERSADGHGQPWDASLVIYLTTSVLLFGLLVLGMMTFLFARSKNYRSLLPSFAVPLIVIAAVILVLVGYGPEQIAPVIGLLGTVAGYLLGREGSNRGRLELDAGVDAKPEHSEREVAISPRLNPRADV